MTQPSDAEDTVSHVVRRMVRDPLPWLERIVGQLAADITRDRGDRQLGDGTVGAADLSALLGAWGACN